MFLTRHPSLHNVYVFFTAHLGAWKLNNGRVAEASSFICAAVLIIFAPKVAQFLH